MQITCEIYFRLQYNLGSRAIPDEFQMKYASVAIFNILLFKFPATLERLVLQGHRDRSREKINRVESDRSSYP